MRGRGRPDPPRSRLRTSPEGEWHTPGFGSRDTCVKTARLESGPRRFLRLFMTWLAALSWLFYVPFAITRAWWEGFMPLLPTWTAAMLWRTAPGARQP